MVVTRKPGSLVPPPPTSRTNSSQVLSRHSHKPHEAGPNPKAAPGPAPSTPSLPDSKPKVKKKPVKKQKQSQKRRPFIDSLLGWFLPVLVLYIVSVCPSDTTLQRPVCWSLSVYSDYVLRPYVLPPVQKALEHPAVQPYVKKVVHLEQTLEPYIVSAVATTSPYAIKSKEIIWDGAAVPVYRRYLLPQYYAHIYPHLLQLYSKLDPYISPIHQRTTAAVSQMSFILHRVYTTTRPHLHRTYVAIQPYAIRVYETSRPVMIRLYDSGKVYAIQGYDIAKPYVRLAYFRSTRRLRRYLRKLTALRKQYVDKHVGRIWEKVEELSASRDPKNVTASPMVETKAELMDSTSSIASQVTKDVETTETTLSSSSTVSPAETVAPERDSSSSSAETLLSASSASSVPGEISASVIAESSASAPSDLPTTCNTPSAALDSEPLLETAAKDSQTSLSASAMVESLPTVLANSSVPSFFASAASAGDEVEPTDETGDDDAELEASLQELLHGLGLSEPEPEKQPSLEEESTDEPAAPTEKPLTPEEKKEMKRQKTAEERADITGRHEKWTAQLDELIKTRKKSIRKMLVRVRKECVKSLSDKSPEPEAVDDVTTEEDMETMRFIEGERVSFLLDNLVHEGEKLLKGLETYLRKEEKAIKASSRGNMDDRIKKWETFLEKVEDKFSESSMSMQGKVHRWYIQVRDIEIRDCLAASDEVKAFADKAQVDLALDYAWLDDVTYYDWQKYHELMRAYERFDEQIRLIQNGTHPSPPIDPLPKALDKLQKEMDEVLAGWATRVRSINHKAMQEIFVAESEEPEVSILPIEPRPVTGEQEGFDASQVIMGKSEAQIKEALKDIPIEHEEL